MNDIRRTFANQFENLEILGSILLLVDLLEIDIEVNLSRDLVMLWVPRLQFIPAFNPPSIGKHIRCQLDMTQECFLIPAVVDVHADF